MDNSINIAHQANNKTILVTGSSKRIGAEIIRMAHTGGYDVIIHYNKSYDAANALAQELNCIRSDSAKMVQADLRVVNNEHGLKLLIEEILACFGRLDALVHNASIFAPSDICNGNYQELIKQWENAFLTNCKVPFFLTHALLTHLEQTKGTVVSILDIHADIPYNGYPLYNMAKASHQMMVKSLALELAPNIRINGVAPGTNIFPDNSSKELHSINITEQEKILSSIPLTKIGQPSDIAQAVDYLLKASYVTGQTIKVDGGRSLVIAGS